VPVPIVLAIGSDGRQADVATIEFSPAQRDCRQFAFTCPGGERRAAARRSFRRPLGLLVCVHLWFDISS
jgi:hypothetical protein